MPRRCVIPDCRREVATKGMGRELNLCVLCLVEYRREVCSAQKHGTGRTKGGSISC